MRDGGSTAVNRGWGSTGFVSNDEDLEEGTTGVQILTILRDKGSELHNFIMYVCFVYHY